MTRSFESHALGVRNLRLMLDELVAYFDGNLSEDEVFTSQTYHGN